MAHFTQLDENNIVIWVTPVDNSTVVDENGVEQEELGIQHLHDTIPWAKDYNWKQTSYNNNFRKRYAGVGYTYNEDLDAFVPPQPYPSWTFNDSTADWDPPIPKPENDEYCYWNEDTQSWILIELTLEDENA